MMLTTFRGTYNPLENYNKLDVVVYKKSANDPKLIFLCITTHTSASPQEPNPSADTSYWCILNADSSFPETTDNFIKRNNIQASDITNINRYEELFLKSSRTPIEDDELNSLTNSLRDKLLLMEDINHIQNAISNLEYFFLAEVQGFINQKQVEFEAEINKFTFLGEYNPTTQYRKRNTISYNGESYLCLADSLGNAPNPDVTTTYWAKIAQRGSQGEQGVPGTGLRYKGIWNVSTQYFIDDAIQYGGQIFACLQDNIGQEPNPNQQTAYWSLAVAKGSSTKVTMLTKVVVVNDTRTNISIGIPEFNATSDGLLVIKNSVVWTKGVDYNINANGTSIDSLVGIIDGTQSPIEFLFIVWKNMVTDLTFGDGTMIQDGTVSKNKLSLDVQNTLDQVATNTDEITDLSGDIGDTSLLETTDKSNLVGAVNEVKSMVTSHEAENATDAHNATAISVADTAGHFIGTEVEAVLAELFTFANDGKTGIANAVTAKGVAASSADTFSALATKIGQINTGKRFATGSMSPAASTSSSVSVSGLAFQPKTIIIYTKDSTSGNMQTCNFGYSTDITGFYYADGQQASILRYQQQAGSTVYRYSASVTITTSGFTVSGFYTPVAPTSANWIAFE